MKEARREKQAGIASLRPRKQKKRRRTLRVKVSSKKKTGALEQRLAVKMKQVLSLRSRKQKEREGH